MKMFCWQNIPGANFSRVRTCLWKKYWHLRPSRFIGESGSVALSPSWLVVELLSDAEQIGWGQASCRVDLMWTLIRYLEVDKLRCGH